MNMTAPSICEPCERSGQSRQALLVINGAPVCRRCARGNTAVYRERYLREEHTEGASPLVPEPKLHRKPPILPKQDRVIPEPPRLAPVRLVQPLPAKNLPPVDTYLSARELVKVVVSLVEKASGIEPGMIFVRSSERRLAKARHAVQFLLTDRFNVPLAETGRLMERHHTSVLYAVLKVRELVKTDSRLRKWFAELESEVREYRLDNAAGWQERDAHKLQSLRKDMQSVVSLMQSSKSTRVSA